MSLSDTFIRNAKPADKPKKLWDAGGLFLLLNPQGSRWWRLKYRFNGKEKLLSLGVYPDTGLKDARAKRDEARKLLANGIDPGVQRKAIKAAGAQRATNSFAVLAEEWLAMHRARMSEATFAKAQWTFHTQVNPWIGSRPIADIEPPEILRMLRRIEGRGAHETAHRTKQRCGQVFRFAIATGRASHDPTADLRGALAPVVSTSRAAITDPTKIGPLLRAIESYQGSIATKSALQLAPHVFVRPGELRNAEWSEIDFVRAQWRISAARMKMREEHIVPLSLQAIAILQELQPITGHGQYLFPGHRGKARTMSENTINAALRNLGFDKTEMTGHGFRAMASTLLNEMGWPPDVIERQLAHAERNKVRAAYNRAQYLEERGHMMQSWSDYLDRLRIQEA
jgi:integrase